MDENLFEAWREVDHHYNKIKICRKSLKSSIVRHNYRFFRKGDKGVLRCLYCGHKLVNDEFSKGYLNHSNKSKEDKNKGFGDITIYRIYWYKKINEGFLKFPGLNYIGQTKNSAYKRILGNGGHFNKAFNAPSTSIEHSIRKYGKNFEFAKKIFRFKIIQIVKFQGNWTLIEKIKDSNKRKKMIEKWKRITLELANKIEQFWIGFYHSQFYRFGRNILPGGRKTRDFASLNYNTLDNVLEEACVLPRFVGRKDYVFERLNLNSTQNRILDNNIRRWYGIRKKPFETIIRKKRLNKIKELFEKGYKISDIAKSINADRSDIRKWLTSKIYNKKFPKKSTKEIRKKIISSKVRYYIGLGIKNPSDLLQKLPGFKNSETIKHFIRSNISSWYDLIDEFSPKKDYWNLTKKLIIKRYKKNLKFGKKFYTSVEFARILGSKANSSSAAIKYIKRKLNTELSWSEIIDQIIENFTKKI